MKTLLRFACVAFIAATYSCHPAEAQPLGPREATAAEAAARVVGGGVYVSPRRLVDAASTFIPIGTIAPAALDNGTWLSTNGQVVAQATYPDLFKLIGHQPEFNWTSSSVGVADLVVINQIAFANATYVAVGASGKIYTSPDLTTWTSRTSGVATALNDIAWDSDNSQFVSVGASNVILTSPDGITWTSRTSGVTSTLARVVHASARTVAVGTSGWVSYSTDDVTWTAVQPNAAPSLKWLFFANATWFACEQGSSSTGIVFSTNGTAWTFTSKPTTNSSEFAGFDAAKFYLTDFITGQTYSSSTGAAWALVSSTLNWPVLTNTTFNPAIMPSGIIYVCNGGGVSGYTDDGFNTLKRPISLNGSLNLSSGGLSTTPAVNPLGNSAVTFALVSANVVSVDGKRLSTFSYSPFTGSTFMGNVAYKPNWANGKYFIFGQSSGSGMCYAPAPYAPATQFQIPTRTDTTGTALLIKAL